MFHTLSLGGNGDLSQVLVAVMNTDDCFQRFLLNTTNQPRLISFLNPTADNIQRAFSAALTTGVSMVIANPEYGGSPMYVVNWTTSAYHGTWCGPGHW